MSNASDTSDVNTDFRKLWRNPPGLPPRVRMDQRIALVANIATLAIALWQGWSFGALIWPYWLQSVAIGVGNLIRMQRLSVNEAVPVEFNGNKIAQLNRGKGCMSIFFAMHYGLFHWVYFGFLIGVAKIKPDEVPWILIGAGALLLSQAFITRRQLREDARIPPPVQALMSQPYLRIVPIHLTIMLGIPLLLLDTALANAPELARHVPWLQGHGAQLAIVLFGGLKTWADYRGIAIEHALPDAMRRQQARKNEEAASATDAAP